MFFSLFFVFWQLPSGQQSLKPLTVRFESDEVLPLILQPVRGQAEYRTKYIHKKAPKQRVLVCLSPCRPPKKTAGTETAFRHEHLQAFPKKVDIPELRFNWWDQTRVDLNPHRCTRLASQILTKKKPFINLEFTPGRYIWTCSDCSSTDNSLHQGIVLSPWSRARKIGRHSAISDEKSCWASEKITSVDSLASESWWLNGFSKRTSPTRWTELDRKVCGSLCWSKTQGAWLIETVDPGDLWLALPRCSWPSPTAFCARWVC